MSIICNASQKMRKDVFHAFLVKNAHYAGCEEIPCIKTSSLSFESEFSLSHQKEVN